MIGRTLIRLRNIVHLRSSRSKVLRRKIVCDHRGASVNRSTILAARNRQRDRSYKDKVACWRLEEFLLTAMKRAKKGLVSYRTACLRTYTCFPSQPLPFSSRDFRLEMQCSAKNSCDLPESKGIESCTSFRFLQLCGENGEIKSSFSFLRLHASADPLRSLAFFPTPAHQVSSRSRTSTQEYPKRPFPRLLPGRYRNIGGREHFSWR